MYHHVDWGIDNPDVTVRVIAEQKGMPPFAVLRIDDITFYPNHIMHNVDKQLDEIERIGRQILDGVAKVRPQIPRSAA